jgi:hypothetical protein
MVFHGVWDGIGAITKGSGALVALWLLAGQLLLLVVLFTVLRYAARRERAWTRDLMAPEVTRGTIIAAELDALAGGHRERKAYVRSAAGRRARRKARHVLEAGHELARQIARDQGEDTPRVEFARTEVLRLRAG